jgi:hypothetical protein
VMQEEAVVEVLTLSDVVAGENSQFSLHFPRSFSVFNFLIC